MLNVKGRKALGSYSLLSDSSVEGPEDCPSSSSQHNRWSLSVPTSINVAFLLINLLTGLFLLKFHVDATTTSYLIHSPLNRIITKKKDYWNLTLGGRTEFTEAPSEKVDALWNSITAPPGEVGTIKVQKDDLERDGLESVEVADGSGYLATVDVFHQLHCLDLLRKYIFNSTYQISPIENPLWEDHIAHCLDSIRLSLQCNADVSLITWKWLKGYGNPWPDFRAKHECRNWDDILDWVKERKFDPNTPGSFVHPELGLIDNLDGKWFHNPLRDGRKVEYISYS